MSVANSTTDTAAIQALVLASQNSPVIFKDSKGRDILLRPTGGGTYVSEVLTPSNEVLPTPAYIKQTPKLQTTTSLITYLNRFKTDATVLFADVDTSTIVAAIDYHSEGSAKPGICQHQAVLKLPFSLQWQTWIVANSKPMDQKRLAEFVQDNFRDFEDPLGLDILGFILDMDKTATIHVGRKMKRAGSDQGNESRSIEIVGSELPPEWKLSIPVYRGEDYSTVSAYCREKMTDSENLIWYKLANPERVVEDSFFAIATRVAEASGVPIVLGALG